MSEVIQSLSICCPSANGKCINHCKTCTARQHTNPYENKFDGNHTQCFEYWEDVIKRMKYAQSKGCTTVMLTGSNEPQQNRRWLEGLYLAMQTLPQPFVNIEIQTTGALLDEDYLRFLKKFGVTTVAVSAFNIDDDEVNRDIEESADKNLNIQKLCDTIESLGMNVRVCVNVTDYVLNEKHCRMLKEAKEENKVPLAMGFVKSLLSRCKDLHANQVTFRKMWSVPGTDEDLWIQRNGELSKYLLEAINKVVVENGTIINKLPYGAIRYDYLGFSIVIDTDSMAKNENNVATKYYIIRENGKMYSSWDSEASIVF